MVHDMRLGCETEAADKRDKEGFDEARYDSAASSADTLVE
jgi:hypothetical protein